MSIPSEEAVQARGKWGCLAGGGLWLGGTIAIAKAEERAGAFLVTMGIAVALAIFQNIRDGLWREALLREYRRHYGDPPSGLKPNVAGIGHFVGGPIGGILGGAAFLYSEYRQEKGMSEHQRSLHNRVKMLEYGGVFGGLYMFAVALGVSWFCIWVVGEFFEAWRG